MTAELVLTVQVRGCGLRVCSLGSTNYSSSEAAQIPPLKTIGLLVVAQRSTTIMQRTGQCVHGINDTKTEEVSKAHHRENMETSRPIRKIHLLVSRSIPYEVASPAGDDDVG